MRTQTEAVEGAQKLKYPLHLTGTALQLFELAKLKGLGKEPGIAVSKVWDSVDGPYFPRAQVQKDGETWPIIEVNTIFALKSP